MNLPLPTSSSSSTSSTSLSNALPFTHFTLPCPQPTSVRSKFSNLSRVNSVSNQSTITTVVTTTTNIIDDQTLLWLLRHRKTEEAWTLYTQCNHLPNPTCLSRLVSQLSYQKSNLGLTRAQSILTRLRHERQLHRLDANSLGLLAVAATKSDQLLYAVSLIKSMLRSGYLPHVKAWSAVVSGLASCADDGPTQAIKLFKSITRRVRRFSDEDMVSDSKPDTAYVGFGDLETAETVVQAMRERRRDMCKILREVNFEVLSDDEDDEIENSSPNGVEVFEKLLPNSMGDGGGEPPLLPKAFEPNSRIYTTLMKGYMKQRRVSDTLRTLEAMRHQDDKASHPDHVTYTTVVSAFVKAGLMEHARQVLAEMTRIGVPANRITYNILLKGYCQHLEIDKAKELLKEMTDGAKIEPDVVSYNTMIDGCIKVDDSQGALAFFNEMRAKGILPTKVSYTTLMKAFALLGQPKLANKIFDEMIKDPRVKVDMIAWNMLVEGYCRMGLVEEAKKVIQKMKENGFYPNVATYGSLANGISLARKPGEALLLWKEVQERCGAKEGEDYDPNLPSPPPLKPDKGLLDTLADICVRAAFFKKALEIVACMEDNGIPPNKTKYKKIYVEMHSRMFTSKHASQARQDRRRERKRAAEAFKFWLGLPNSYYSSEWQLDPFDADNNGRYSL
ncbi:hypothetical protein K2173_019647 [Erythroxylum novogranatense]|uniref:Pentatricopeptide repeat-containing protein n=1 Tax=Erythroxylum novogranatense TaxID=1862640 RepID=A0AAV8UF66_9ROSI|nr:hypothetical protein K2173_019647 [Erythroxylum novogranatense]